VNTNAVQAVKRSLYVVKAGAAVASSPDHHVHFFIKGHPFPEKILSFIDLNNGRNLPLVFKQDGKITRVAGFAPGEVGQQSPSIFVVLRKVESNAVAGVRI
jgi:hypothetical protein